MDNVPSRLIITAQIPMSDSPNVPPESSELLSILITEDLTELEVVRGLLESAGIATITSGLEQAQLLGTHLLSGVFGKRLMGARLLVHQDDMETAKSLIATAEGGTSIVQDSTEDGT